MQYLRETTPIANLYRLAAALYQVAEHEAKGHLGHWQHLEDAEIRQIQVDALDFTNDWRTFFVQRLGDNVEAAPMEDRPYQRRAKKRQRATKPRITATTRIHAHLSANGPGTSMQIAQSTGISYERTLQVFQERPDLFRIVGYSRNRHTEKRQRIWGLA